ncbi:succinate dehydrogenase cytochrome b subunit [Rhodoflexus caldus]|uniref:succinate dehydrogenase cytochrome b subunit n=1 Tax=Rhodoflexus caldus TaxID=2891236 RepID=UPI00202A396F|nr:succinate dehydrogenase cytochrome b subunit [Rhodoflexus caldus]
MNWFTKTLTSTIGRKVVVALTGLFLCLFLVVHLLGNLQLLANDGGKSFNLYAKFMTTSPIIQTISIGNFAFILLHIIQSTILTIKNRQARPVQYAIVENRSSWASRNMGFLGSFVLLFIVGHLAGFWWQMKFGQMPVTGIDGVQVKDLYLVVSEAFKRPEIVAFYVLSMGFIGFHLSHGFQSAFQTLGLNHVKYTPLIQKLGLAFCILIPLGYAVIPVMMYLRSM